MRVVVSPMLPIPPSVGEVARRTVRHGLADVLAWLGEPVGPKPGDQTHAFYGFAGATSDSPVLFVSQHLRDQLATVPRGKTISYDLKETR